MRQFTPFTQTVVPHYQPSKMKRIFVVFTKILISYLSYGQKPRARDLGVPFNGITGINNAITDVIGVEVGYSTIISGKGDNVIGKGPVRTGVTAIFPRGKSKKFSPVYANWYSLNGNGEMTGTTWVTESGFLETPIMITNTNSVGVVRDAVLKWYVDTDWYNGEDWWYTYPVVAETYDGFLNDIYGFHVKEEHVLEAIKNTSGGKIAEGNVGGGTGTSYQYFGFGIDMIKVIEKGQPIGTIIHRPDELYRETKNICHKGTKAQRIYL